jgi:hypothetical protein
MDSLNVLVIGSTFWDFILLAHQSSDPAPTSLGLPDWAEPPDTRKHRRFAKADWRIRGTGRLWQS